MTVNDKLAQLREKMEADHIHGIIIPGTDPHMSEYLADHWKARELISGFNGSAGTVVVTLERAGLWTDSRYFLQAEEQLHGTGIDLFKMGQPGVPTFIDWLAKELNAGETVAMSGWVVSIGAALEYQEKLQEKGILWETDKDLVAEIWTNRPALPKKSAFPLTKEYTGSSTQEKLDRIRKKLEESECDGLFIGALDELAWAFNLRGSDVSYNPVVVSYGLITLEEAYLFVDPQKVDASFQEELKQVGIIIKDYAEVFSFVRERSFGRVWLDPQKTNDAIFEGFKAHNTVSLEASPLALMKSCKNSVEVGGMKAAHLRDGVAMVRFLKWLEEAVPEGGVTELSAAEKLFTFRAAQKYFKGESFNTITGYATHGAIVHYSASPETDVELKAEGLYLLDSGGQYLDGTTDITRTLVLGDISEQMKRDFTLVLKGHINLASIHFPNGTCGRQLDVLARQALWNHHLNYGHGTGHGVGCFLNVHEGPQTIRMEGNDIPFQEGMVLSNEPGLYKAGEYGIRTENLVVVVDDGENEFGSFLRFETLTLCPIERKAIVAELLTTEERNWLNAYHQRVFEMLSPLLNALEIEWLREKTKEI